MSPVIGTTPTSPHKSWLYSLTLNRLRAVATRRLHTGASAAALAALRDSGVLRRLGVDATAWWAGLPDERKWRRDAGEALLRARLLHPPDLDAHLSQVLLVLFRL